jgi:hypothetical protein
LFAIFELISLDRLVELYPGTPIDPSRLLDPLLFTRCNKPGASYYRDGFPILGKIG